MQRAELERLVLDFTAAFNRDDLDGVMSYFAEDSAYDEFNGTRSVGKAAIRAAFEPQFAGKFGTIRFLQEDLFVDPTARKAMISWECTLTSKDRAGGWRGLDLIHFDAQGHITLKETYAKTEKPLMHKRETKAA